jgi:AcrR family transcriptional regulator
MSNRPRPPHRRADEKPAEAGRRSRPAAASAAPDDATDSRERILYEATRLFAERGYDGASLSALAEAVGMQKGSLVYHFRSKEGLWTAVMDGVFARWRDVLPAIMLAAASGENRFTRAIEEFSGFFRADSNRARLLIRASLDHPAELRHRLADEVRPWLALVVDRIREGGREGTVRRDVDAPAYVATVVVSVLAMIGLADLSPALLGDGASTESATDRLIAEVVRLAWAGLFVSPAPTHPAASAGRAPHSKGRRRGQLL